jgi:MFS family permease
MDRILALMPPTPFGRLVRTHLVTMCADACIAASLAGSLFFAKPSSGARGSILLYLLLTMAPFAIVAPVIGPTLDRMRGGRRFVVVGSCVGRAVLCLIMAQVVTKPSPEGLLIYPFAFGALVLSKGYSVARSSLVPALVDDPGSLVKANSRLQLISLSAGLIGGAPAFLIARAISAEWSLLLAMVLFIVATLFALRIPRVETIIGPEEAAVERQELHQPSILLAGSAMALLRGAIGFLQFFAAFTFKDDVIGLAVVAGAAGLGILGGNVLAPRLRAHVREEIMLVGSLVAAAAASLLGALFTPTLGVGFAFLTVGVGAAAGKIGFDSLLQRDGPDAVRGRAFAQFETRFQAAWVIGAALGIIPVATAAGLTVLGIVLAFGGVSYLAALRAARTSRPRSKLRPEAVDRAFDRARDNLRDRRRRSRTGRRRAAATKRKGLERGSAAPAPSPAPAPRRAASTPEPVPPPPRRARRS